MKHLSFRFIFIPVLMLFLSSGISSQAQQVVKIDGAWIQVNPSMNPLDIFNSTVDLESKYGPDAVDLNTAFDAISPLTEDQNIWNRYISGADVDCGTSSASVFTTLKEVLPNRGWDIDQMWSVDVTLPLAGTWDFFTDENVAETATGHAVTMLTSPNGEQYMVDIYSGSIEMFKVEGVLDTEIVRGTESSLLDAYYTAIGNGPKLFRPAKTDYHVDGKCPVPEEGEETETDVLNSWDPNDKLGANGVSDERYVINSTPFEYVIRFENADTASAPAQEVIITDSLDTNVYDLESFELGSAYFGSTEISVPAGLQNYTTVLDMRPEKNFLVHFHANLDAETGRAFWKFTTLDPETMQLPADPLEGFLPPNTDPPVGDGGVNFTIELKENLPTGTEVRNEARIVFDLNKPIDTPPWINTIDESIPSSSVSEDYTVTGDNIVTVNWSGTDPGSGIKSYDIFVSLDGEEFNPIFTDFSDSTFTFKADPDRTYEFYSIAKDRVGNIESPKNGADMSLMVTVSNEEIISGLPDSFELFQNYPNPFNPSTTINFALPEQSDVTIRIYDVMGRQIATLLNENRPAGYHNIVWDAGSVASGTYFYRIQAGSFLSVKKLTLVK